MKSNEVWINYPSIIALRNFVTGKSIAVVGNSGCELGKRRGSEIDAHEVVFRFNRYSLMQEVDYGKKVTAIVTSYIGGVSKHSNELPVFSTLPTSFSSGHLISDIVTCIDEFIYDQVNMAVGTPPSTGTIFLYWLLLALKGKLSWENLYGFSFFDPSVKHHYFENFAQCGHDGLAEKKFVNRFVGLVHERV